MYGFFISFTRRELNFCALLGISSTVITSLGLTTISGVITLVISFSSSPVLSFFSDAAY